MSIARDLAVFLTRASYADIPPQALEHAAMLISSTVASAACGSGIGSASIIRALARDRGGRPDASIWFDSGPRLPAADAAQVNAVMSDAAASDDSDLRNIVHAGTTLVATSFAIAERTGASGQDVLAAIVLGYEASGRIGEAITPTFQARGFHGCLVAIFGGVVAAARLLQLDEVQTAQAIALSATSIGGLRAAADTSTAREYHAGLAAMLGIHATLAAQRGYVAEERILETHRGFCAVYGDTDGASITRGLGDSWDIITDMAIKLVPGGHPSHSPAEAAANAATAGQVAPGGRDHNPVATGCHRAYRADSPHRSYRHGAQPRLLPGRWRSGPRILLVACNRGQDHGSCHPSVDRQGPGRFTADPGR